MALKTKKTEEERERERREREAQRRNSAYQSNEKRIRNSAVLGGYQASGNSRGTSSNASQKTSSAALQRPTERRQIPSLQKTTSRSEQRRNYQEENARNAQRNIQNDNRRFSTGKELQQINNGNDVDKWVQSDYKLSKEEVKKAKEITSDFYKKHPEFNGNTMAKVDPRSDLAKEAMKMATLRNKTSLTGQIGAGLMDTIKSATNAFLGAGKALTKDEETKQAIDELQNFYGSSRENARTQNGLAYGAGQMAGKTAQYMATNPLFDRAAESLGATSAAGKFITNQLGQNAQDLVLDTLPTLAEYARDGSVSAEERRDLAKNVGMNVAGNLAIPAIGAVGSGIASALRASGMPDVARAASNVDISDAIRQQNIMDAAELAQKNIPEYTNFPNGPIQNIEPEALDLNPFRERVSALPEGPLKNQMSGLLDQANDAYNNGHSLDARQVIDDVFANENAWNDTVRAAGGDIDIASMRAQAEQIPNLNMRKQYNSAVDSIEDAVRNGRVSDARQAAEAIMSEDNLNVMRNVPYNPADDPMDLGLSRIQSDSPKYAKAVEKRDAFKNALERYRAGEITADELKQAHDEANYAMRGLNSDMKKTAYRSDAVATERINNANLEISDVKKALGKKNGKGKVEVALSKKDIDSYRRYPREKAASVLNRLNKSTKETGVSFREAGKGEVPLWDRSLMDRLAGANDALREAKNPDVGLGNFSGTLYDAYMEAIEGAGDAARGMDNTDLANRALLNQLEPDIDDMPDADTTEDILRQMREAGDVQNDDAIQAIGEMAARETEAPQLPGLEQTARQAQDQIPGMENVNGRVDNVNEAVDGGTGRTDIPGMEDNAGRTKTSQTYTNTGKYGGGWNEAEYKAYTDAQNYQYETVSEKESVERAWQTIREEGADNAKERLLNTDNLSGSDLDALMSIWRMQVENARAVEASGGDAAEMWKESNRIFKKIQTESTHNAQALQALAKWSRNTPEGMLSRADAIINGRTGGTDAASASMEKVYNKYFKDKGKIELSEDFQKNFLDLAERYQGATGREREELMAEMGKLINKQIPVKLPEKIKTYLMDSMLGNFRTLITRNAGGNIGFNAVEQTAERPLAALVDSIIGKKTGRRTQAGLSREALSDYMSGFGKGLSDEWKDFQKTLSGGAGSSLHTARSGESTLEEAIANNRQVFSSFIGDKADQLVKHGLSVGDRPFYEAVYKETLGDYNRMYKAGQMGADVQSLDPETFKEYAEAAAKMNALSACYQDDSALAKGFMDLRNGVAGLSKGVTGVDILSQFAMPFVKTPANIISRAVEYSPLGFIKNAVNTGRDMAVNAAREGGVGGLAGLNAAQQNRLANETARNILGTGLFAGGYAAAKSGLISGGYSDDKDEAAIQRANGMQEYALHTGDDYRSIDWVPVLGNNLVAASAFQEAVENNNGNAVDNFGAGLAAGLESQFDTSMLQGLQSLFGSDAYDRNAGIIANVENTVKSGATQAIPSIIRQAAAFDDPYKRQLSGANPDDYYINSMAYSIPGIRRGLEPKINNQGEALEQNAGRNTLQKFYDNFISPYSTTTETHTPLDDEAMRLSQSIGSDIAFVTSPSRKDITTESYTPSDAEYTNYQRDAGRLKKEIGEGLLQSDFYKQLNDTDKAETLSDVYTAAKAIAREPFTGADPDDRYAKVYKADGLEGVLSYINANINSKKVNFDAEGKGKGLTSANARGKFDAISTTGLSAEEQGKIYYNTLSASEQEKLSDFYNSTGDAGMYQLLRGKALANEDGNGAVKIQEVLDYATSFPEVSEAVVNQLASSATGTFKKEDGVWNYYNKKGKLTKQGEKKQYNYTAPKIDYGAAKTEESSGTQNNSGSLTVNAAESSRYSVSSVASNSAKKDTYKLTDKQLNSASYGRYQELSKALPDYKISNKDYDDMYKAIDADSNESLKKAEITAYLDSRDDLTSEEKSALFSVYGHSNWKNPYAGGSKTAGSGSGKSSGKKGSGRGSSRKSKKIAFQSYERMNIPSLRQLDSGRASLRSLSGGGGGGNVIPGLNLSNINLGGSGSIPSIASLMNRYQNMYR